MDSINCDEITKGRFDACRLYVEASNGKKFKNYSEFISFLIEPYEKKQSEENGRNRK